MVELPLVDVEDDRDGALVPEGVPPPLGATAPPGDAAELRGEPTSITTIKQQAKVAVLVASEVDRLWTSALAMNYPFCAFCAPGPRLCPNLRLPRVRSGRQTAPATLDVSGYGPPNRW